MMTTQRVGPVGGAGHIARELVVEEQNQDIVTALEESVKTQTLTEPPVTQTHAQRSNALGGGNGSRAVVTYFRPIGARELRPNLFVHPWAAGPIWPSSSQKKKMTLYLTKWIIAMVGQMCGLEDISMVVIGGGRTGLVSTQDTQTGKGGVSFILNSQTEMVTV